MISKHMPFSKHHLPNFFQWAHLTIWLTPKKLNLFNHIYETKHCPDLWSINKIEPKFVNSIEVRLAKLESWLIDIYTPTQFTTQSYLLTNQIVRLESTQLLQYFSYTVESIAIKTRFHFPYIRSMALFIYSHEPWMVYFNMLRLPLFYIGLVGNVVFIITVAVTPFKIALSRILLLAQATFDLITCLVAIISIHLDYTLENNGTIVNKLLCKLWITNWPFFLSLSLGLSNLFSLCVDRFWGIIRSTTYSRQVKMRCLFIGSIIVLGPSICTVGIPFQMDLVHGWCNVTNPFVMQYNAHVWVTCMFFIPVLLYALMYIKIYYMFHTTKETSVNTQRKLFDRFNLSLLTTVLTQLTFIAPDQIYFVIASTCSIPYEPGSPIQTLTSTCLVLNSCVTPFIFLCLLKNLQATMLNSCKWFKLRWNRKMCWGLRTQMSMRSVLYIICFTFRFILLSLVIMK